MKGISKWIHLSPTSDLKNHIPIHASRHRLIHPSIQSIIKRGSSQGGVRREAIDRNAPLTHMRLWGFDLIVKDPSIHVLW